MRLAVYSVVTAVFLGLGLGALLSHRGVTLMIATLLYVVACVATLRLWDSRVRYVRTESARLEAKDAERRAEYFIHMKQQILLARRISSEQEFREILESLLEMFGEEPDLFRRHTEYVRGELGSL